MEQNREFVLRRPALRGPGLPGRGAVDLGARRGPGRPGACGRRGRRPAVQVRRGDGAVAGPQGGPHEGPALLALRGPPLRLLRLGRRRGAPPVPEVVAALPGVHRRQRLRVPRGGPAARRRGRLLVHVSAGCGRRAARPDPAAFRRGDVQEHGGVLPGPTLPRRRMAGHPDRRPLALHRPAAAAGRQRHRVQPRRRRPALDRPPGEGLREGPRLLPGHQRRGDRRGPPGPHGLSHGVHRLRRARL
mmetsp:Transcript_26105/g.73777  ORF Transcript_26105/g.73777 Transcript_26105/m.73777 type:complete len:245 (-) Transcript_26105:1386-2120(-)